MRQKITGKSYYGKSKLQKRKSVDAPENYKIGMTNMKIMFKHIEYV